MFRLACLCLALLLPLLPHARANAKNDADLLQGKWVMRSLLVNGRKPPDGMVLAGRLEVKGDRYTVELGGVTETMTLTLDQAKRPKTIDLTLRDGDRAGKTSLGIYKLEGDTFTMCREAEAHGRRPTEFESKAGSGAILVTWKRPND
jgi:uncharacterized protein (TIGR03067 family)